MQLSILSRARLALALFALCGLGIGRLSLVSFQHAWSSPGGGTASRFIAKYETLKPYLSPQQPVGYLPDVSRMDLRALPLTGRLSLAQYALSPPIIEPLRDQPLILFESDDPQAMPDLAVEGRWTLVADLHNGLKLFRTVQR